MMSLTLDMAILLLLVVTLVAGYRLHQRLQLFRIETSEFEPLIQSLDEAAKRAETVLTDFRKVAEDVSNKLTSEANATQRLVDELDFLTKRADSLAETLEHVISDARHLEPKQPPEEPAADAEDLDLSQAIAHQDQRRRAPDLERRLKTLR